MRTVALRWIFTLRRVCRTRGWHKANLFGWCSTRERHWPNWTLTQFANSLQVLERIGGDDGTRTRGLCRDRREVTRWPTQNQAVRCAAVGNRWLHWERRVVFMQRFVQPSSPCRAALLISDCTVAWPLGFDL